MKSVFNHFFFKWDLLEQRLVMFPDSDEVLAKFTGVKPPCCEEMKRSVPIFRVHFLTVTTGALFYNLAIVILSSS